MGSVKHNKFNLVGFSTLVQKEVSRFLSVYLQTIIAPVITTLLFYVVFATVFVGTDRVAMGYPFMVFLAPGLIMMAMAQNAFANTSSSLIIGKIQGNLDDILMAPISALEFLMGYVLGGVIRGIMIGMAAIFFLIFFLNIPFYSIVIIVLFSFLGCTMLALFGILGGLWAEKFDHLAAITNFVVTPLTFLSGTFYSMERIAPVWQDIAAFNPIFYMIDGFRYGFLGTGDASIVQGALVLMAVNTVLFTLCLIIVKTGYKIKD